VKLISLNVISKPYVGRETCGPILYHGTKIGPTSCHPSMQISLESLEKREDPYQLFLDSLTNEETKRKYVGWLSQFLKVIPEELYQRSGQTSMCQDLGTLARCFVSLAKKDPDMAKNIIAEFIKEEKKLVAENKLSPNTIPNHIKPIKSLLDANGIAIHWKSLHKMY
jgi:hypothetical protein